jgi:hypothetical protein
MSSTLSTKDLKRSTESLRQSRESRLKSEQHTLSQYSPVPLRTELRGEVRGDLRSELRGELRNDARAESRNEPRTDSRGEQPRIDIRSERRSEPKSEARSELRNELRSEYRAHKAERRPDDYIVRPRQSDFTTDRGYTFGGEKRVRPQKRAESPGPGAYNPSDSLRTRSPIHLIAKSPRRLEDFMKRDESPGPAYYPKMSRVTK